MFSALVVAAITNHSLTRTRHSTGDLPITYIQPLSLTLLDRKR